MAAVYLLLSVQGTYRMDSVMQYFSTLELNWPHLLKLAGVLLLGCLLIGIFGRFIFGKKSAFNSAISAAIGIIFICAVSVVLNSFGIRFEHWISPLPFVSIQGESLTFFNFFTADYTVICNEVLSMITLAFLINLIDGWLSKTKNFFGWLFFRCITVVIAYGLHLLVSWLFTTYFPEGLVTYAPVVLLALLVLLILTGALKVLVGAFMATINPLIGALYTFFFANIIGKQITKATLTTAILAGLIILLQYLGVTVLCIATSAQVGYIPFVLFLIALWYLINRLL